MKFSYQERLNACLGAILSHLPARAPGPLKDFTHRFYQHAPVSELERQDAARAAAVAVSAYAFMEERSGDGPKIRLFFPSMELHGYESRHLVIELINDDMPFLVDSLSAELIRQGLVLHETLHPIFAVRRDRKGRLENVSGDVEKKPAKPEAKNESFIHFEVSGMTAEMKPEALQASLEDVLAYIRAAVSDWKQIERKAEESEAAFARAGKNFSPQEAAEAQVFMRWLRERNFVFLGSRDAQEALGICRLNPHLAPAEASGALVSISKSDVKSVVHRGVLMDIVTVKLIDGKGNVSGTRQFVGLFTSAVYYQSAQDIPLVRRKIAQIMDRSGFDPISHDGKALGAIMEFLPRDELFQYGEEELFETGLGILALEARPGVRLFVRHDPHQRFVSCMVFVPREHFSSELRISVVRMLSDAFEGRLVNFYTQLTDSPLARLQVILRTTPGLVPEVDISAIEADIARTTHLWSDALKAELIQRFGETQAEALYRCFAGAFTPAYISYYSIRATVFDIEKITEALTTNALTLDLYRAKNEPDYLHLKIYSPGEEIALSDFLPVLERMGLRVIDEHPFRVTPEEKTPAESAQDMPPVWIRDFKLSLPDAQALTLEYVKPVFEEALLNVWRRQMESDGFNALILRAGLSWRQVVMLRAYAKYMKQCGFPLGQETAQQALYNNPAIAKNLVALFLARFDPAASDHEAKQTYLINQLEAQLAEVESLGEDRVLRHYIALINATLRTNYFQEDATGAPRPVLSFKFHSAEVPGLPKPVPFAEIFVYSARVEGIHLRGGKVARGGLRWSDRPEDFRTEILGLMKAQMVKNAVIVPVGSKGGFVLKQPPAPLPGEKIAPREALQQEGIACYSLYLQGLLDITDNIRDGEVTPPAQVHRHDGDDPYLVVAADKGTATFSDIANGISHDYGFWLGDAFASGGSAGYDHKKMAITARGAWVSVTRHFAEMGIDIARESFTAVGIGDMSGDVFGNGMLLSNTIRLIAAFDHRNIFLDPDPDAQASFDERQRLFALPRSSWKDYDAKKISRGGGIFDRSAKTIALSREIKTALAIEEDALTPDELIRAILRSPVDLLWNGGIGTYVKAEDETDAEVGDRTNNGVRVNGRELRCKIVGEGGNLGFTQKGRVEYARFGAGGGGGRINTDAIDNSGGVDCSDHEVNIKIAFSGALAEGRITRERRDALLEKMTAEVASLVLKDNTLQTQAISVAEAQGGALLESQARLIRRLEKQGLLDRAVEFLPTDRQIADLRGTGKGLTRPELAVLLAYAKIALCRELLDSGLPDEPYFAADLARYFPRPMQKDFAGELSRHPLKREIIATVATNSLVNRAGITFYFDAAEDSGKPAREVVAAYTVARDAFRMRELWSALERETGISALAQSTILALGTQLIERVTMWGLRHLAPPIALEEQTARLAPGVEECRRFRDTMHTATSRASEEALKIRLLDLGVPEALAQAAAELPMLSSACDIVTVTEETGVGIASAGAVYFAVEETLSLGWLRGHALDLRGESHWDRVAARALAQDVFDEQRRLAVSALRLCAGQQATKALPEQALAAWQSFNEAALVRYARLMEDLRTRETLSLSALLVALKQVREMR